MKKIEMLFYPVPPSAKNIGMKFVLFEITDNSGAIIFDWGFADWLGTSWDYVEAPAGFTATVKWWANTVDPQVLVKEKSRIIKL